MTVHFKADGRVLEIYFIVTRGLRARTVEVDERAVAKKRQAKHALAYFPLLLTITRQQFFLVISYNLQSIPVHSANCVNIYTVACRRVRSSAPL
jgi:hypothetical protein